MCGFFTVSLPHVGAIEEESDEHALFSAACGAARAAGSSPDGNARAARAAGCAPGGRAIFAGAPAPGPGKISRLSFIFAIIGLGVLVLSLLFCAYIVDSAVHSAHPENGGFVWIIPFAVYMGLLLPINLIGLITGSQKVGPSVSGRQRMWSLLGIVLNVLPWVIAVGLLVWI